jgi:hypothetical protein
MAVFVCQNTIPINSYYSENTSIGQMQKNLKPENIIGILKYKLNDEIHLFLST